MGLTIKSFGQVLRGFYALIRFPNLLIIVLSEYLVRICLIGPKEEWLPQLLDFKFALLVFSTVFIASAGYIINDYYDIKIDLINKPDKVVVGHRMPRRTAMMGHFFLNFIGISIGFALGFYVGLINFFSGFLLWLYSNQLKRLPFVGNFVVAILTGTSVWIVAVYFNIHDPLIYVFATFAFFTTLMREIVKDMEDLKGDRIFGCKTLPIIWGYRRTKRFIYGILSSFIATVVYIIWQADLPTLNIYFLLMLIPTIYFVYKLYWSDTQKSFRYLSHFLKGVMLSGVLVMLMI